MGVRGELLRSWLLLGIRPSSVLVVNVICLSFVSQLVFDQLVVDIHLEVVVHHVCSTMAAVQCGQYKQWWCEEEKHCCRQQVGGRNQAIAHAAMPLPAAASLNCIVLPLPHGPHLSCTA